MRIGVDTGGTFSDFVIVDDDARTADGARGAPRLAKTPSTPGDPSAAILSGLRDLGVPLDRSTTVVHGTTVATNRLLEGRLARVTLITDRGLEDVIEIGRQARPDLYTLEVVKPAPMVPRGRRIGVAERTDKDGVVRAVMTAAELSALVAQVQRTRPEAIAIATLFSFKNDQTERRLAEALAPLGVPISVSSQIAPEVREFERFSTTVANAALVPAVARYLGRLQDGLGDAPLFVFQSNGGMARVDTVAREPVRLVLSGPAGGAIAAARIAARAGLPRAMTLDMGGTSTDVSLLDGAPLRRGEIELAGIPLLVPSLDIESVGAGGGSIAWIDDAGLLRVGPRSAGADPGPACYGRSELPTVTDAHVSLGRMPKVLAGGRVALDFDRSYRAMQALGARLGLSAEDAAEGVLRVADATMARAARRVALSRGVDPRGLPLIAFGGAGPLHAARLIRALPCAEVLVPPFPGNLSAWGMAHADAERDRVRSVLARDPDQQRPLIDEARDRLCEEAEGELREEGLFPRKGSRLVVSAHVDCRYVGQSYTLPVTLSTGSKASKSSKASKGPNGSRRDELRRGFDAAHKAQFGHAFTDRPIEAVNVRVRLCVRRAAGARDRVEPVRSRKPPAAAVCGHQTAWFAGQKRSIPCFDRELLAVGSVVHGPAIILELGSTCVIEPGHAARVDGAHNLRIRGE